MNIFRMGQFALVVFTGLAILVGCDTNESVPSRQPMTQIAPATAATEKAHADHRTSWMALGANKDDLLYVSDQGSRDVYIFSYPQGALVGTLTGFVNPRGEICNLLDHRVIEEGLVAQHRPSGLSDYLTQEA